MSSVEFNEEVVGNHLQRPQKRSGTANFLLRHGLAPNEMSANVILLIAAMVFIGLSVFIYNYTNNKINVISLEEKYQNIDQSIYAQNTEISPTLQ